MDHLLEQCVKCPKKFHANVERDPTLCDNVFFVRALMVGLCERWDHDDVQWICPHQVVDIVPLLSEHVLADRTVAMHALRFGGETLWRFSGELRDDEEVVRVAIHEGCCGHAIFSAGPTVLNNIHLVYEAIHHEVMPPDDVDDALLSRLVRHLPTLDDQCDVTCHLGGCVTLRDVVIPAIMRAAREEVDPRRIESLTDRAVCMATSIECEDPAFRTEMLREVQEWIQEVYDPIGPVATGYGLVCP